MNNEHEERYVVTRLPNWQGFLAAMAEGECLCDEIDPADIPCMTCEAQEALREQAQAIGEQEAA